MTGVVSLFAAFGMLLMHWVIRGEQKWPDAEAGVIVE
jgi:hypothetical protein